jgi:hypothetical protein
VAKAYAESDNKFNGKIARVGDRAKLIELESKV